MVGFETITPWQCEITAGLQVGSLKLTTWQWREFVGQGYTWEMKLHFMSGETTIKTLASHFDYETWDRFETKTKYVKTIV